MSNKKSYGKAGLVDRNYYNDQIDDIKELLKGYKLRCIYNFDESGLLYKLLKPNILF